MSTNDFCLHGKYWGRCEICEPDIWADKHFAELINKQNNQTNYLDEDMKLLIRAAESVISMAGLSQQLISDEDLEKLKKIVKRINPNG